MTNQPQKSYAGIVTGFGEAPYQHDENNSPSYFVQLKMDNGQDRTIWAMGLRESIEKFNIQPGEAVNLLDMGAQDGSKRHIWEVERHEPYQNLQNSIEPDIEQERQAPTNTPKLLDFDKLPSNIKNNYVAVAKNRLLQDEKVNFYDKDDKNQVNIAFEYRNNSLHTSRQDEKTIHAMLDLAQSKNWTAIKLKGTEEFKQKAWLEASLRGIATKGYQPNEKDLAELQLKQTARTTNEVNMEAQKAPEPQQQSKTQEVKAEQTAPIVDGKLTSSNLDNQAKNQAYLEKIGSDFSGATAKNISNSFDKTREYANDFVSNGAEQKELVNFHNGYKAIISKNNLDKMLSNKAHEKSANLPLHLTAVANADKLFENAVFGWQHKDKDEKSGNHIHRAIAPLKIDDQIYVAKLTVKELAREQGNRFYSLEAVEIEQSKSPIPEMVREDLNKQDLSQHRHNRALIDTIVQNAQQYNSTHEKTTPNLQNNNNLPRFAFAVLNTDEYELSEIEKLRHAVHIRDNETYENYVIGTYASEYDDKQFVGVIADYYESDLDYQQKLIGNDNREQVFAKLGMHKELKDVIAFVDGDKDLTTDELDKHLSKDNLQTIVKDTPNLSKHMQVAYNNAQMAGFDKQTLSYMTMAMLGEYDTTWHNKDNVEKNEAILEAVSDILEDDKQKYNQFIDNFSKATNLNLSYMKLEVATAETVTDNRQPLSQDEVSLKQSFSNIGEYSLNQDQLNAIENWRRYLTEAYQDSPDFIAKKINDLNDKIPDIAGGKFNLPPIPDNKIMPTVETPSIHSSNHDRTR